MRDTRHRMTPRELMDSLAIDCDLSFIEADVTDISQQAHFDYLHFHFSRWNKKGQYKEYCKSQRTCLN